MMHILIAGHDTRGVLKPKPIGTMRETKEAKKIKWIEEVIVLANPVTPVGGGNI